MATELRWILAALSALLLGGIWWWGARRARRAPGALQGRSAEPEIRDREAGPSARPRSFGVPPFEPLSVRTGDFEEVQITDLPMTAHADSLDEAFDAQGMRADAALADSEPVSTQASEPVGAAPARAESARAEQGGTDHGRTGDEATHEVRAKEGLAAPHIVSVRVAADGETRWPGVRLLAAFHEHGLTHGRYQVFHREHVDGSSLFCAASLVEPGTFDLRRMPGEEFRGVTLFAVLPGPADALYTFDSMLETACGLAQSLDGTVQDADGTAISAQRAVAMREEVARAHSRNAAG